MNERKTARNSFAMAVQENQAIGESFRGLMHDTFNGIYMSLGRKNLLRWVNIRKISERIKNLIVEEFSKEDVEKHPTWAGYYAVGTNREKLREGYIEENTARHESLHFMTDEYENETTFPTFLDEGLTEYLNRELEKVQTGKSDVAYVYKENVDFVEFLHSVVGDSLIKAYLTGTSIEFYKELSTYFTEDGLPEIDVLREFYESANRWHSVLHPKTNPKTKEEREKRDDEKKEVEEKYYPNIMEAIVNIVSNAVGKKAHDLEYYEDGNFNIIGAAQDVITLTRKAAMMIDKKGNAFFVESYVEFGEKIYKKALARVLQESHIPNDKIEDIVNKSIVIRSIPRPHVSVLKIPLQDSIDGFGGKKEIMNLIDKRLRKYR